MAACSDVSGQAGPPFGLLLLGRGLAAGDLDNDGRVDALVVAQNDPLVFLHNQTNAGHFVTVALEGTVSNRDGVGASVVVVGGIRTIASPSARAAGATFRPATRGSTSAWETPGASIRWKCTGRPDASIATTTCAPTPVIASARETPKRESLVISHWSLVISVLCSVLSPLCGSETMATQQFENLRVYQMTETLADEVWDVVQGWNTFAKDTVGKQLVRAADSVGANIAEGTGRGSYRDNRHFARIARGSLYETRHWLRRAFRRKLLSQTQIATLKTSVEHVAPTLNAYINSIGRTKPKPKAEEAKSKPRPGQKGPMTNDQ